MVKIDYHHYLEPFDGVLIISIIIFAIINNAIFAGMIFINNILAIINNTIFKDIIVKNGFKCIIMINVIIIWIIMIIMITIRIIMTTNSLWLAEQAMCWGKRGRWQNGSQAGARGPEG